VTNENIIHEEIINRLHHGNISYYLRQIILSVGVTVGNVRPTYYNMYSHVLLQYFTVYVTRYDEETII